VNPMRIDVHHHLLTPEYVQALAAVGIVEAGGLAAACAHRAHRTGAPRHYEPQCAHALPTFPELNMGDKGDQKA